MKGVFDYVLRVINMITLCMNSESCKYAIRTAEITNTYGGSVSRIEVHCRLKMKGLDWQVKIDAALSQANIDVGMLCNVCWAAKDSNYVKCSFRET